jgi:hypothetical protein
MTDSRWEPLPADVAEWMGMDEAMVPLILAFTDSSDPSPRSTETKSAPHFS